MCRRIFAIVPAAGQSRRMGQPKLLLPWRGSTVMDEVASAWVRSHVTHVVVVIRKDDAALREVCCKWPLEIIQPSVDPADMKASVQFGLSHVAEVHRPTDRDQWMVAPADLPRLSSGLINRLIDAGRSGKSSVVVPRYGERPGHPLLFPWSLSRQVFSLPENEGINRLLEAPNVEYLDLPSAARVTDVDTPQDYQEMFDESQKP